MNPFSELAGKSISELAIWVDANGFSNDPFFNGIRKSLQVLRDSEGIEDALRAYNTVSRRLLDSAPMERGALPALDAIGTAIEKISKRRRG